MIKKTFTESLRLIDSLQKTAALRVNGGPEFFRGKEVTLVKGEKQFTFSFNLVGEEERHCNEVLEDVLEDFQLKSETDGEFWVPKRGAMLTNVNHIDFEKGIHVIGSLSQISSCRLEDHENKYHRVIIPVSDIHFSFYDFGNYNFNSGNGIKNRHLIKVAIGDQAFDLFTLKFNDNIYWGVDSHQLLSVNDFREVSFSIFLAFGFLKGNLHLNEAYYFSSTSLDAEENLNLFYSSIRNSFATGYGMITQNAYSIFVPYFKERHGEIDHEAVNKKNNLLHPFHKDIFSKLAETIHKYDSISRATLIVLEGNTQALELKAASYCVAFEAVCDTIKKLESIKSQPLIDKKQWSKVVLPRFKEFLLSLKSEGLINEDQDRILGKKLDNLNQPTNADTLSAPFKKFGYTLNPDETECIKNRNLFLHGSLPISDRDVDQAFGKLYHISMTLHKLIYILILKMAGYEGYIINYPKLHEHITGKNLVEEPMIMI